jgi:hypothetical protein
MHLQHILQFCFTIGSQINLQYNAQIVGLKLMFKNTNKIINDDPIIISHKHKLQCKNWQKYIFLS